LYLSDFQLSGESTAAGGESTDASGESAAAGGESTDASGESAAAGGESSRVTKEGSSHHLSNVHNRTEVEEAEEEKVIADIVETAITKSDACVLKLRTRNFVSLFNRKCIILQIIKIIM
jgi:hypothetical protein